MEDLFQVGVITAPHGVRGEVKVFPTTDDNARFKNLKTVLLDQGRGTRELIEMTWRECGRQSCLLPGKMQWN